MTTSVSRRDVDGAGGGGGSPATVRVLTLVDDALSLTCERAMQPDAQFTSSFRAVSVDACDGVVVAGGGNGPIHWDGDPEPQVSDLPGSAADSNIWIAKLDAGLNPVWGRIFGSTGNKEYGYDLAVAPNGDLRRR